MSVQPMLLVTIWSSPQIQYQPGQRLKVLASVEDQDMLDTLSQYNLEVKPCHGLNQLIIWVNVLVR